MAQNNNQLLSRAIEAYNNRQIETAYDLFSQISDRDVLPKEYFIYYSLTLKSLHRDDYLNMVDKGLTLYPGDRDLILLKIEFLSENQYFSQALELLETVRNDLLPEQYSRLAAFLHYNLGIMEYREGRKSAGAEQFRMAFQLYPQESAFLRNYAVVLMEIGEKEKAREILETYAPSFPTDKNLSDLLIQLYAENKEVEKLEKLLVRKAKAGGTVQDSLVLGQFYLSVGKNPSASLILQSLKKNHPTDQRPWLIEIEFWKKQLQRARVDSLLGKMENQFPNDTTIWKMKLDNYLAMDSLEAADRILEKFVKDDYRRFWAHQIRLDLRKKEGMNAVKQYLTELSAYDWPPEIFEQIGHWWFKTGDYDQCKKIFNLLLKKGKISALIFSDLGLIYQKNQNPDSADYYFRKATELSGDKDFRAYFGMAELLAGRKEWVDSKLYFEIGMELLLKNIGALQEKMMEQLQQSDLLINEKLTLEKRSREHSELEEEMKRYLMWYGETFGEEQFLTFLTGFENRFPKNKHLKTILGQFFLKKNQLDKAEHYFKTVLYMDKYSIPVRRSLIAVKEKHGADKGKLYHIYREIFLFAPDSMKGEDYRKIISLARQIGAEKSLAQEWLLSFDQGYRDSVFVSNLIELLHFAGFHDKAREVHTVVSEKRKWKKINPYLHIRPSIINKGEDYE